MNKILKLERILCPVAELHETDEALQHAILLARSYGAKLFILTCANESASLDNDAVDQMRSGIERAIEHSFVSSHDTDAMPVDWNLTVVDSNRPAEAIVRAAASHKPDLIVMGSHRRSYVGALLLGSTAEAVSRTAPCPVLVTRLPKATRTRRKLELKKLLVATDFSSDSDRALQYGLSLAQEYQAELHLVHVINGPKSSPEEIAWDPQTSERPYHAAARQLHESVPAEVHLWSRVTHAVREGRVDREIVSYAGEQQIDLICIGAHGKGSKLGTLFGTNMDRVLRTAPCPVLVARPLS